MGIEARRRPATRGEVQEVVRGLMHKKVIYREYAVWQWQGPNGELQECRSLVKLWFGVYFPRVTATIAWLGDAREMLRQAVNVWR